MDKDDMIIEMLKDFKERNNLEHLDLRRKITELENNLIMINFSSFKKIKYSGSILGLVVALIVILAQLGVI